MGKRMRRKRKRPSILSRLEEEIRNFLRFYAAERAREELRKGIEERKVELLKPPRRKLHPKAVALIRMIVAEYLRRRLNK